jgi:formate dehydrogenase assembly factor FdhD
MRTPGDDEWLAAGLLYGEGVVNQASDIEAVESSTRKPNVVNVRLHPSVPLELQAASPALLRGLELRRLRHHRPRCRHRPGRRHAHHAYRKASICPSCSTCPQRHAP